MNQKAKKELKKDESRVKELKDKLDQEKVGRFSRYSQTISLQQRLIQQ